MLAEDKLFNFLFPDLTQSKTTVETPSVANISFESIADQESKKYGLDSNIVRSLINQESGWKQDSVSPKGAIGIMQIMPETGQSIAQELGEEFSIEKLKDPETNIRWGTYLLAKNKKIYGRDDLALAAYHGGPGAIRSDGTINPNRNDGLINTTEYVSNILNRAKPVQETQETDELFNFLEIKPLKKGEMVKPSTTIVEPAQIEPLPEQNIQRQETIPPIGQSELNVEQPSSTQVEIEELKQPSGMSPDQLFQGGDETIKQPDTRSVGTVEAMVRSMGKGAAELGLSIARTPQTAAEIFVGLNNILNKGINKAVEFSTGKKDVIPMIPYESIPDFIKIKEGDWDTKAVRSFIKNQNEAIKLATNGKGVVDNIATGNFGEAGKALGVQAAAQIPLIASMFVGGVAGLGAKSLGNLAGVTTASQQMDTYWQNVEEGITNQNPDAAAVNALVNGFIEKFGEQLGTGKIISEAIEVLGKAGKKEIAKKTIGKTVGQYVGKVMNAAGQEGTEEAIVGYSQAVSDKILGARPDITFFGAVKEGIESGIVGAVTSAGTTGQLSGIAEIYQGTKPKEEIAQRTPVSPNETLEDQKTKLLSETDDVGEKHKVEMIEPATPIEEIQKKEEEQKQKFEKVKREEIKKPKKAVEEGLYIEIEELKSIKRDYLKKGLPQTKKGFQEYWENRTGEKLSREEAGEKLKQVMGSEIAEKEKLPDLKQEIQSIIKESEGMYEKSTKAKGYAKYKEIKHAVSLLNKILPEDKKILTKGKYVDIERDYKQIKELIEKNEIEFVLPDKKEVSVSEKISDPQEVQEPAIETPQEEVGKTMPDITEEVFGKEEKPVDEIITPEEKELVERVQKEQVEKEAPIDEKVKDPKSFLSNKSQNELFEFELKKEKTEKPTKEVKLERIETDYSNYTPEKIDQARKDYTERANSYRYGIYEQTEKINKESELINFASKLRQEVNKTIKGQQFEHIKGNITKDSKGNLITRNKETELQLQKIADAWNIARDEGTGATALDVPEKILHSNDNWSSDDVVEIIQQGLNKQELNSYNKETKARTETINEDYENELDYILQEATKIENKSKEIKLTEEGYPADWDIAEDTIENSKTDGKSVEELEKEVRGEKKQTTTIEGQDVNINPTEAQKEAGNYKKAHIKRDGMDISIENPAGSVRSGTDSDGETWSQEMKADYGYINGTKGKDKDHVDVFIKPGTKEEGQVFVINQVNPKTGKFDEHKIVFGSRTKEDALKVYNSNYEKDWKGAGSIVEMTMDEFKKWVYSEAPSKGEIKLTSKKESFVSEIRKNLLPGTIKRYDDTVKKVLSKPVETNINYLASSILRKSNKNLRNIFDEEQGIKLPEGTKNIKEALYKWVESKQEKPIQEPISTPERKTLQSSEAISDDTETGIKNPGDFKGKTNEQQRVSDVVQTARKSKAKSSDKNKQIKAVNNLEKQIQHNPGGPVKGSGWLNMGEKIYFHAKEIAWPILKIRQVLVKAGVNKKALLDKFDYQIDTVRGASSSAQQYIKDNYEPIFKLLKGLSIKERGYISRSLSQYLVAKRSEWLYNNKDNYNDEGISYETSKIIVDYIENEEHPNSKIILEMADKIWKYNKKLIDIKHKSGIIDEELVHNLREPYYVPFFRDIEKNTSIPGSALKLSFTATSTGIKRIKGSKNGHKIIDPIQLMIATTQETIVNAEKVKVAQNIVEVMQANPDIFGDMIQKIDPKWRKVGKIEHRIAVDAALRDRINALANKIGIKVETAYKLGERGVPGSKKRLGIFDTFNQKIRVLYGATESTRAHELGHALDSKFKWINDVFTEKIYKGELSAIANSRYEGVEVPPKFVRYVNQQDEKIAEFIALYLTNRPMLKKLAPKLFNTFEKRIAQDNVLKELKNIVPTNVKNMEIYEENNYVMDNTIPADEDVISMRKDGKIESYRVPVEIAMAVKNLHPKQIPAYLRLTVGLASRVLRFGAVGGNIGFAFPNVTRDQVQAAYNTKTIPFVDWFIGARHFITNSEVAKAYQRMGGGMDSSESGVRGGKTAARSIVYGSKGGQFLDPFYWKNRGILKGTYDLSLYAIQFPFQPILSLVELSEMGTRLGVFPRQTKNSGVDINNIKGKDAIFAIREAVHAARQSTLDFQRFGYSGKLPNELTPFINAALEGFDRMARSVVVPISEGKVPIRPIMMTGLMYGIYAGLTAWNREDPWYKKISSKEKQDNWIIMSGENDGNFLKIPKDHTTKFVLNPGQMIYETIEGLAQKDGWGLAVDIFTDISPINEGNITPVLLKLILEPIANYDFYWKNHIEDPLKKSLPPGNRFKESTSETLKTIGKALNISPLVMQHEVKTAFGGLGTDILWLTDWVIGTTGLQKPPELKMENAVVIKRFVGLAEEWKSDSSEKIRTINKRIYEIEKTGKGAKIRKLRERGYSEKEITEAINRTKTELNKLYRKRKELKQATVNLNTLIQKTQGVKFK